MRDILFVVTLALIVLSWLGPIKLIRRPLTTRTKLFIALGLILPLASFGALAPSRGVLWGSATLVVMGGIIVKYWLDWRKELTATD
jgi:hypothetical protein